MYIAAILSGRNLSPMPSGYNLYERGNHCLVWGTSFSLWKRDTCVPYSGAGDVFKFIQEICNMFTPLRDRFSTHKLQVNLKTYSLQCFSCNTSWSTPHMCSVLFDLNKTPELVTRGTLTKSPNLYQSAFFFPICCIRTPNPSCSIEFMNPKNFLRVESADSWIHLSICRDENKCLRRYRRSFALEKTTIFHSKSSW